MTDNVANTGGNNMTTYEDGGLDQWQIDQWADAIRDEDMYQRTKHGKQDRTAFEWLAYLGEEVGELNQAIIEHHYRDGQCDHIRQEAIQVATLAIKIAQMMCG